MKHTIPTGNWTMALANAIKYAQDGDTIRVHNAAMQELAKQAHQRMYPDKKLTFEIQAPSHYHPSTELSKD